MYPPVSPGGDVVNKPNPEVTNLTRENQRKNTYLINIHRRQTLVFELPDGPFSLPSRVENVYSQEFEK